MTARTSPTYLGFDEIIKSWDIKSTRSATDLTKFNRINRTGVVRIVAKKFHSTVYSKPDFPCGKTMEMDMPNNSEQGSSTIKETTLNSSPAPSGVHIVPVLFSSGLRQVVCKQPFRIFIELERLKTKTNPNVNSQALLIRNLVLHADPAPFQSPPFHCSSQPCPATERLSLVHADFKLNALEC